MQATVLFQKYLKPLALPLILFPAMAHSDDDWTDVVLTKIRGLQYQETLNDPFSNQQQADRSQEAGSTPTSCVRHPLACAFDLYEKKGLFEATIGGCKRSDSAIDGFFNKTAVFTDANVFVTLTTLLYLMDANQYLSEDMSGLIDPAVEAIADFHDRNTPDASLVGFWEQESINNYWVTYSTNGSQLIEDLDGIETVLRDACELIFSDRDCEAHFPGYPGGKAETYLPSDTDDTSENLSVGALLAELQTNPAYQAAYQAWRSQNSPAKIKAALGQIIHYAYDADGQSAASNLIDPRTFYFLSGFYEGGAVRGTRIPTTWLLDDDEVFEKHYRGRGEWPTPHLALHNVNDIDPIELGHFITAVARLDRSGLLEEAIAGDESFADDLGKIALNATEYIAYLISNDVPYSRPDILAPYYAYAAQAYEALGNFVAWSQGLARRTYVTFPAPAPRTRRADFRHRALQRDHAPRTRIAGANRIRR